MLYNVLSIHGGALDRRNLTLRSSSRACTTIHRIFNNNNNNNDVPRERNRRYTRVRERRSCILYYVRAHIYIYIYTILPVHIIYVYNFCRGLLLLIYYFSDQFSPAIGSSLHAPTRYTHTHTYAPVHKMLMLSVRQEENQWSVVRVCLRRNSRRYFIFSMYIYIYIIYYAAGSHRLSVGITPITKNYRTGGKIS